LPKFKENGYANEHDEISLIYAKKSFANSEFSESSCQDEEITTAL